MENGFDVVVHKILENPSLKFSFVFIVIYLVMFILFGRSYSNTFDFAALTCLLLFLLFKYVHASEKKRSLHGVMQETIDFVDDPSSLFTTGLFIICFYLIVFILRIPIKEDAPFTVMLMGFFGWILLVVLGIHNGLKLLFNIDVLADFRDTTTTTPDEPTELHHPEVFNISDNLYTYDDSQAICKAYDSRLATYDEVESAYNNGAEWCNYGWSANQMAFFPTQKKTWEELQKSDTQKNNCGRPGVNGGFFANPNIKFGVNCFGIKPKAKNSDVKWMETKNTIPFPQTEEDKKMEEKVKYWKENLEANLKVSSFNKDKWSRF